MDNIGFCAVIPLTSSTEEEGAPSPSVCMNFLGWALDTEVANNYRKGDIFHFLSADLQLSIRPTQNRNTKKVFFCFVLFCFCNFCINKQLNWADS